MGFLKWSWLFGIKIVNRTTLKINGNRALWSVASSATPIWWVARLNCTDFLGGWVKLCLSYGRVGFLCWSSRVVMGGFSCVNLVVVGGFWYEVFFFFFYYILGHTKHLKIFSIKIILHLKTFYAIKRLDLEYVWWLFGIKKIRLTTKEGLKRALHRK